jgi:uncharacterized membrane protein YfcA
MMYLVVCAVALLASALTFFSGFGLGTLLLPAFALFFPVEQAVAMTAVVHFFNGVFKLALVGRHVNWRVAVLFGGPAILAAIAGAWALGALAGLPPVAEYSLSGRTMRVEPAKLVVGVLLVLFALAEVVPRLRDVSFAPAYLPLGGVLSGFFGGLAGTQGALRSAFLVRAGLSKEAFIATGAAIACVIDVSRLVVYGGGMWEQRAELDYGLLAAAVAAAFAGAMLGNMWLKKMTMRGVQRVVAAMLLAIAAGLIAGVV